MTREQKLALIVGFSLILFVGVLISDHLSSARKAKIARIEPETPAAPISLGSIPAPGPAPESQPAAPAARDPLDLIMSPGSGTQTAAATPAPASTATPETAPVTPPPITTPPATLAARPDTTLADEVRRLGGDVVAGADGMPTIKLPPAIEVVTRPVVSEKPAEPAPESKKTIATPVGPLQPLKTHEVRAGDTLFQITQRYYGNGNLWRELAKFNNMDREGTVRVGSRLKIPSKDVLLGKTTITSTPEAGMKMLRPTDAPKAQPPKAPSRDRSTAKVELARYTVKKGDTLGVISQRTLGTSKRWQEIADLNNLDDEDSIAAGTVLKLPPKRS